MKKLKKLIATQTFTYPYGRKHLVAGDEFEPESESDANILVVAGKAKPKESDETKRTYRRRDMRAEH